MTDTNDHNFQDLGTLVDRVAESSLKMMLISSLLQKQSQVILVSADGTAVLYHRKGEPDLGVRVAANRYEKMFDRPVRIFAVEIDESVNIWENFARGFDISEKSKCQATKAERIQIPITTVGSA